MMDMITKVDLEKKVEHLIEIMGRNLILNWNGSRPRLELADRFISPRLSAREMYTWLEAFETGLEYSGTGKMKEALSEAPILPTDLTHEPSPRVAELMLQWSAEYSDWYNNKRAEAFQLNSHNEAGR